jgi:hypothetical protein
MKDSRLYHNLSEDEVIALKKAALDSRESQTEWLTRIIREALEKNGKEEQRR